MYKTATTCSFSDQRMTIDIAEGYKATYQSLEYPPILVGCAEVSITLVHSPAILPTAISVSGSKPEVDSTRAYMRPMKVPMSSAPNVSSRAGISRSDSIPGVPCMITSGGRGVVEFTSERIMLLSSIGGSVDLDATPEGLYSRSDRCICVKMAGGEDGQRTSAGTKW